MAENWVPGLLVDGDVLPCSTLLDSLVSLGGASCQGSTMQTTNCPHHSAQPPKPRGRGRPRRASRGNEPRQVAIVPHPTPAATAVFPTNNGPTPTQTQPQPSAAVPAAELSGPPTGDDSVSGVCLAEALNGLVKRVRQLERDNARLRKRQRKHRKAMRELRSLVAQHQHAAAGQPRLEQKADLCRPATAAAAAAIPHQPQCPPDSNAGDRVVLQQFPFLWDYDMRGRPFVGADPGKPTLVSHFVGPLQARHMFVNPQLCRLVGHSQEDLLFSKPRTFMILVPNKTWLLHRLLFGTGEPMGVSDIVSHHVEMMQRTGHMVDAHIRVQFFNGPTGQLRCVVICVEDVLGVRCPPWAQGGACDMDEEQYQQTLELYCDQLKRRAELEWRQFRDTAHTITPAASATPLQSPSLEEKDFQLCF